MRCERGLAEVRLPARVEVIARQPAVILDSAHNTRFDCRLDCRAAGKFFGAKDGI